MKEEIAPRKRVGREFPRGTCECTAEVIIWVGVSSRKPRTAAAQNGGDMRNGRSTEEQFLGDPFIGDTPVGLWKALENAQSEQPTGVDVRRTSDCGGTGQPVGASRIAVRGCRQRIARHQRQTGATAPTVLGSLQQRGALGSQAGVSMQHLHPRRVTALVATLRFLIREAGQTAQMAPIGAGRVATVEAGQAFADVAGNRSLDGCGTDSHPSLEIAGAGLEYYAGFVTSGPHGLEDGWIALIQIDEDVTGIALLCVGMDVHIAALPIANAQEPDSGQMDQLVSGPQPLSGKWPSGLGMDETDEIEIVRHGGELAADGLQGEVEPEVEHGPNCGIEGTRRTMNSQRTANSGLTGCLSLGVHRTEVQYFRIYDLRSTYATRLSAGGVADEWVTQLLRQGDAKVFKKYSQMKLQMKREALAKLNRKANEKRNSGTGEAA